MAYSGVDPVAFQENQETVSEPQPAEIEVLPEALGSAGRGGRGPSVAVRAVGPSEALSRLSGSIGALSRVTTFPKCIRFVPIRADVLRGAARGDGLAVGGPVSVRLARSRALREGVSVIIGPNENQNLDFSKKIGWTD